MAVLGPSVLAGLVNTKILDKGNILKIVLSILKILIKKGEILTVKKSCLTAAQCNGIAACAYSLNESYGIAYSIHRIVPLEVLYLIVLYVRY